MVAAILYWIIVSVFAENASLINPQLYYRQFSQIPFYNFPGMPGFYQFIQQPVKIQLLTKRISGFICEHECKTQQ